MSTNQKEKKLIFSCVQTKKLTHDITRSKETQTYDFCVQKALGEKNKYCFFALYVHSCS